MVSHVIDSEASEGHIRVYNCSVYLSIKAVVLVIESVLSSLTWVSMNCNSCLISLRTVTLWFVHFSGCQSA